LTWDDHEVAKDRDERLDANFLKRRAAAYQAFYEHMPVRLLAGPAEGFAHCGYTGATIGTAWRVSMC
jgi:alkaline phosphatase D